MSFITAFAARLRRAGARHRLLAWSPIVALAAVVGLGLHHLAAGIAEERDRWGSTRDVLVTTASVGVGSVLDEANTTVRRLPTAALPDGALPAGSHGLTAAQPLAGGQVVTATATGRDGRTGAVALLPAGWRALALARGAAPLPLAIGDRVELIAVAGESPAVGAGGVGGALPAPPAGGVVVHVTESTATVAVTADAAARLAPAALDGRVLITLSG